MLQFSDSLHVAKRYRCKPQRTTTLHTARATARDKTYTHNTVLCEIGATARRVRGSVALGRAARHTGKRPQRDARAQPRGSKSTFASAAAEAGVGRKTSTWKGAAARLHGPRGTVVRFVEGRSLAAAAAHSPQVQQPAPPPRAPTSGRTPRGAPAPSRRAGAGCSARGGSGTSTRTGASRHWPQR